MEAAYPGNNHTLVTSEETHTFDKQIFYSILIGGGEGGQVSDFQWDKNLLRYTIFMKILSTKKSTTWPPE